MKIVAVILLMCSVSSLWAQDKKLGVGVMLGNPTGLNGKYWLDGNKAIDGGFGISPGKSAEFSMHSDYLLHNEAAFYLNDTYPLDLYYGIGGRMEFEDDIELGVRVPAGLVHRLEDQSSDVFGEVAPVFDFLTNSGLEFHFLLGGRYYF